MQNTCSIKFLHQVHIGKGIRMTKDKNTVPFDNKPMKGLRIEKYTQLGFQISHESLPKAIWVDFDQLPLTRLIIKNGVIEDEITFVENIVNHKMQLIRVLDTEYIDLIYSAKELEKIEDKMISVLKAVPGNIYKGARCKDGTEMIFLGNYYTKSLLQSNNYNYRNWTREYIYTYDPTSPRKAFFAVPDHQLSNIEIYNLEIQYNCNYQDSPEMNYKRHENEDYKKEFNKRRDLCYKAQKELLNQTPIRYKIIDYPVTSKVIEKLIDVNKVDDNFVNPKFNLDLLNHEILIDKYDYGKGFKKDLQITIPPMDNYDFKITSSPNYNRLYESKENINDEFTEFMKAHCNKTIQIKK